MRRVLRVFAASLVGFAVVLGLAYVTALVYWVATAGERIGREWVVLAVYACVPLVLAGLVGGLGGILLGLTELTISRPNPPASRGRMRVALQVVAAVQFWGGVGLSVVGFVAALNSQPVVARGNSAADVLQMLFASVAMLALACVGGLLWCVVRLAYGDAPGPPARRSSVTPDAGPGTLPSPA